jgi:hypothetical protein
VGRAGNQANATHGAFVSDELRASPAAAFIS